MAFLIDMADNFLSKIFSKRYIKFMFPHPLKKQKQNNSKKKKKKNLPIFAGDVNMIEFRIRGKICCTCKSSVYENVDPWHIFFKEWHTLASVHPT